MSDMFERMAQDEKERRQKLADEAVQELLRLDWTKIRLKQDADKKPLETSVRDIYDEFAYDLLAHEKEMKECPKFEELVVILARRKLERNLPYYYKDIVEQTDRDNYLHSAISIEDLVADLDTYVRVSLDKLDYEEMEK